MSMDIGGISSMLNYTSQVAGNSKASGLESTLKGICPVQMTKSLWMSAKNLRHILWRW